MPNYLFIESRDPFESRDAPFLVETATALRQAGNPVTVYLVQNAVLSVRKNARAAHLDQLQSAGVTIVADDFSLRERGIDAADLRPGLSEAGIDVVVDLLADGETKVLWH